MPTALPETAACLRCGYSLRGLPGVICPECGRHFDPADPATYRDTRRPARWRRWCGPPGRWHTAAVVAVTLLALEACSTVILPGGVLGPFLSLIVIGGAAAIALPPYAVRAAAAVLGRIFPPSGERTRAPGRWRWLITPVGVALVASALLTRWPLHVRFAASRAALEAEARRLLAAAGPTAAARPTGGSFQYGGSVGWYYVSDVRVDPGVPCVYFFTDPMLIESWGFVYNPRGAAGIDIGLPKG